MNWKSLAGRRIYQSDSGIEVWDNLVFRWLKFESDALQTLLFKPYPHKAGLNYLKPFLAAASTNPGKTCLLGLGGAGSAHALRSHIHHAQITAVEYSEEVIEVAEKYFMIHKIQNMLILHQEASAFIQQNQDKFDHLLVDLSTAKEFPIHCRNETFFHDCFSALNSDGILAVNLANRYEHAPVLELIRQQWKATVVIPIRGYANMVILAGQNTPLLIDLLQKSGQFKALYWDNVWGCMATV